MQPEEIGNSSKVLGKVDEEALVDLPSGLALRQQIEAELEPLNQLSHDEMMPQLVSILLNWRRKVLLTPKS